MDLDGTCGLNNKAQTQRLAHLGHRIETQTGIRPQSLAGEFPVNTGSVSDLHPASYSRSDAQRLRKLANVSVFDHLRQVGGNVLFVSQIACRIERRQFGNLNCLLAHDLPRRFFVRANSPVRLMSRLCKALTPLRIRHRVTVQQYDKV